MKKKIIIAAALLVFVLAICLAVFLVRPITTDTVRDDPHSALSEAVALTPIQAKILRVAAEYLKPGGVMVYSTCTLCPDENERITDAFIEEAEDFEYEGFSVGDLTSESGKLTLLPHVHGTDGFYIARIRKKK